MPPTRQAIGSDHPHACGENATGAARLPRMTGPSPRAWGEPSWQTMRTPDTDHPHARGENRATVHPLMRRDRTIPTRVGRTDAQLDSGECDCPDHPHARGENHCRQLRRGRRSGPSPRAWGEPRRRTHRRQQSTGPSPRVWGERWISKDLTGGFGRRVGRFRCRVGVFSSHFSATIHRPLTSTPLRSVGPEVSIL